MGMAKLKILVDSNQKNGKHDAKHKQMQELGAELIFVPLPVGDYALVNDISEDVLRRKEHRGINVKKVDLQGTFHVSVDTKRDILELVGNVCGKQHDRFRDELIRAKNNNVKLYVLVENTDGVSSILDLYHWVNPRARIRKWITDKTGEHRKIPISNNATTGERLAKALETMQLKYGATFLFCKPEEAGKKILELLGIE